MTINLSKLIPNLLSSVLKPDLPGDNRPYLCILLKTTGKFYIRRNNNKVDSIETGRIGIAHYFSRSDLEKCMYSMLFLINNGKILSSLLNL